jgi:predicted HD phosphohydrolase
MDQLLHDEPASGRAGFHSMDESTSEEWAMIIESHRAFTAALADRVLAHLSLLQGDFGGFGVDRLTHSLQTATRAYRANRDDEYVTCALVHDIGDTLAPTNHPDIAASILKPYVSEENAWMVQMHGLFQGYHYFHLVGANRDARDAYLDHPWYDRTAEFCAEFDQCSFEPSYPTLPLAEFEPALRAVLAKPRAISRAT